ncbi:MAG: hypothetical protein KGJ86_18655 [Chloroflexota bacterium]|nr:hypothetical protein [Chloroflexota bacterium]
MSAIQQAYARDRQRYPGAVGCLMWWGLFAACFAGYMTFFFIMSGYKKELGPGQLCECIDENTIIPLVAFAILFLSQLYMIYLVESRKRRSSLAQTYGLLVISMLFLPVFGTVVGLYLLIRMARDPQVQAYYSPEGTTR